MGIELPAELAGVAAQVGLRWPEADEDAMRQAAQAWRDAETKIETLVGDADGVARRALGSFSGDAADAACKQWDTFVVPDSGHLPAAAKQCGAAADRLEHAAGQIGVAKVEMVRQLVVLAKNNDAARQAAAAGHPQALAGVDTVLRATMANLAQVQQALAAAVDIDSGVTMQDLRLPASNSPGALSVPALLDPVTGTGEIAMPVTSPGHAGSHLPGVPDVLGQRGLGLALEGGLSSAVREANPLNLDPETTGPIPGDLIRQQGPGISGPNAADTGPIGPIGSMPPVFGEGGHRGSDQVGQALAGGFEPPRQMPLPAEPGLGVPPGAAGSVPGGAHGIPGSSMGPIAGAAMPAPGPVGPPAGAEPDRGIPMGTRTARAEPAQPELTLFLMLLFPLGHLPVPASRPSRQLPAPPEEIDYAAGLRFPPQDHPESGLVSDADPIPELVLSKPLRPEDPVVTALLAGYDPLGGEHEREWDRRFLVRRADPDAGVVAEYAWPPGELFPEGGCDPLATEAIVLAEGRVLDRFGSPEGRVLSDVDTPYARRSLPPDHLGCGYHRYRVLCPLPVWRTLSAPWFGQPGGGVRYRATYPVVELVALGYLEEQA